MINKTNCFEQEGRWPLLAFSPSLLYFFSSFFSPKVTVYGTVHTAPEQPLFLSNSSSFLTLNPPQLIVDKSLICPT